MKITARVVEEVVTNHAEGLREYFQDMVALGEYMLRCSLLRDDLMASVASSIYVSLYNSCVVFHKQVKKKVYSSYSLIYSLTHSLIA